MAECSGETFFNTRVGQDVHGPLVFDRCQFDACAVAVTREATARLHVAHVTLRRCTVNGGGLRGVAVSDCVVDGLRASGAVQVLDCAFDRVTLRGRINRLLLDRRDGGAWRDVDLGGTHFAATYGTLARLTWPDHVLVALRTGPKAARAQEVLAALVEAGLATPPRRRR